MNKSSKSYTKETLSFVTTQNSITKRVICQRSINYPHIYTESEVIMIMEDCNVPIFKWKIVNPRYFMQLHRKPFKNNILI